MSKLSMGHFWVPPGLYIKTRLTALPLIWKWIFILMQIKLIFTRKVAHLASFWKWGFWNSAVAFCLWHWRHKQYKGCGSARVGSSGVNELTRQEFSSTSHPLRQPGVACFRLNSQTAPHWTTHKIGYEKNRITTQTITLTLNTKGNIVLDDHLN